jgi:hypothetical protein
MGPPATLVASGSASHDPLLPHRRLLGLQPEDFEPRPQPRGSSDLVDRMQTWARRVVQRLRAFGLEGLEETPGELGDHDDACVRIAYARGNVADATCLVLGVDATGVRAGLELPATQARGARTRLIDPARSLELSTALETLPEQFILSAPCSRDPTQAQGATADDIRTMLDEIERGPASPRQKMWIGWTLPRDVALEHAALLDEQLEDALVALAQVFALLLEDPVSSRDDQIAGGARRFERSAKNGGRHLKKEEGERDAVGARKGHGDRGRAGLSRPRGRGREREGEPDRETDAPEPVMESPSPRGRGPHVRRPPRPGLQGRTSGASRVAIGRGTRVRVLRGAFSGKVGVVHELDTKGNARVMLGLLAVRLEVKNLVPCAGTRPVLSSSHRKPIPDRS